MYYILLLVLSIILFVVLVRILSSLLKGCLVTVFILVVVSMFFLLYKSTKGPVILEMPFGKIDITGLILRK